MKVFSLHVLPLMLCFYKPPSECSVCIFVIIWHSSHCPHIGGNTRADVFSSDRFRRQISYCLLSTCIRSNSSRGAEFIFLSRWCIAENHYLAAYILVSAHKNRNGLWMYVCNYSDQSEYVTNGHMSIIPFTICPCGFTWALRMCSSMPESYVLPVNFVPVCVCLRVCCILNLSLPALYL